jgi:OOP family OmpA-OmpF porin
MTITPMADTVYTLACSGEGGKASSDAQVTVETPPPAAPPKEELCMALNIEFDTDKAVIKPAYFNEVEKVANFMKNYPQVKGTIEGHTDNVGSANYNLKLSQRRSESIVEMLADKYGIEKSRLLAKGYGLTRPIADNMTKEGKQKNRRTEANFGCVSVEK